MTSEGLGEMFEGDSEDTLAGKFPPVLMGGRAEGIACADPVARTPIGASGNCIVIFHNLLLLFHYHKYACLVFCQIVSKFCERVKLYSRDDINHNGQFYDK